MLYPRASTQEYSFERFLQVLSMQIISGFRMSHQYYRRTIVVLISPAKQPLCSHVSIRLCGQNSIRHALIFQVHRVTYVCCRLRMNVSGSNLHDRSQTRLHFLSVYMTNTFLLLVISVNRTIHKNRKVLKMQLTLCVGEILSLKIEKNSSKHMNGVQHCVWV